MARTVPSASDEIVTWSTAASVPTTSTDLRTEFLATRVVATGLALPSLVLGSPAASLPHPAAANDRETRAAVVRWRFTECRSYQRIAAQGSAGPESEL